MERSKELALSLSLPGTWMEAEEDESMKQFKEPTSSSLSKHYISAKELQCEMQSHRYHCQSYLQQVRERLKDRESVYTKFVLFLSHYYNKRIDEYELMMKIKILFLDYQELSLGFNNILPKHCLADAFIFDKAVDYMRKFMNRFQNDETLLKQFLMIVKNHREGSLSSEEAYLQVSKILGNDSNLVEKFSYFIPDSSTYQFQLSLNAYVIKYEEENFSFPIYNNGKETP